MSFAAAVQWFEDWQLRLLVLASLFFQYFLFAAAIVRKLRVPPWFRALIWLAYQAGDVVAIYALATLFNQHKEEVLAKYPASAHLDKLWAPVLLLHLGGQDGITAYSIEDNENWRRYLLLAVCQITIAIYVFRRSWWSGDLILLRAAILLFIPGILKCLEKPWALKNATATSLINSSDSRMEATFDDDDGLRKDIYSQEQYVQAAAECVAEYGPQSQLELFEDELADEPHHLFVDLGHPYSIRLRNLRLVAPRAAAMADVHGLVRSSLSRAFDRLYTKHKASFGGLLRAAVVLLTFGDIGLFQKSHRGVYHRADVVVTYVLLCCTAALEFVSACLVLGSGLPKPDDKLAQYNIVSYLVRAEKHPRFWALVRMLGARLQLDRLWCTAPPEPSLGITRLVYAHVYDGWMGYILESLYERDAATGRWKRKPTPADDGVRAYRRFNDSRGQRTLEREGCVGPSFSAIEESLRMPFDESVLIWHLATEFCYFDHVDTGHDATRHSRIMSNYMAYLLFVEPEMLIPGARSKLFRATYRELRKMLKPPEDDDDDDEAIEVQPTEKKAPPPRAKNEMVRKVIQKVKSGIGQLGSEDLVHKAWAVAHELMEFAKDQELKFRDEQRVRGENRMKVMGALRCAKEKADEFVDVRNRKRDEVMNKLMEDMRPAKEKADEFINAKSNNAEEGVEDKTIVIKVESNKVKSKREEFMKAMKEAKEKAEIFIKVEKTKKQTKEDERITDLLQCAKNKAEEFIKNEEEKKAPELCCTPKDTPEERENKKVAAVKEFSKNAGDLIDGATHLAEEAKKRLTEGKREAKLKAVEFINEATKFINEERNKNKTKEEEKMTELLESAKKAAGVFVDSEGKTAAEQFSRQAGEAIRQEDEENQRLADLREWHLIVKDEDLLMIRSKECADDKMWAVIQGVWVEMLCFSAGRCRGYLHGKSLGNGGEYLSYVWLLLSYMGMETMPERMQRPEPHCTVGDTGALVRTPTGEDSDEEDDGWPAQGRTAAPRRRRASHVAPSATPLLQAGAAADAQTAPQQAQAAQLQQRPLVATPLPAISATVVVPVGDDNV